MEKKFFVNEEGRFPTSYIGVEPPKGWVEVPSEPPLGGLPIWDFDNECWRNLITGSAISAYRKELEKVVITVGGISSYFDEKSRSGLYEVIEFLTSGNTETVWSGPDGRVIVNAQHIETLTTLRQEVVAHRQKLRNVEEAVIQANSVSPYATIEDMRAAFDGLMVGE